jgi:hypothetical protein
VATFPRLGNDAPEHDRSVRFLREARAPPGFFYTLLFRHYDNRLTPRLFDSLALAVLGITNSDLSKIVNNLERQKR